MKTGMKI